LESDKLRYEVDEIEKLFAERARYGLGTGRVPSDERMQVALARCILNLCDKLDAH
jgi:hypothetical protein